MASETVTTETGTSGANVRPKFQFGRWLPIAAMGLLIVLLGAYTNNKDSSFLTTYNLNGVMIATLPLALAAMGQTSALMVKAFDVSVGALMTLCLVVASFVIGPDESWASLLLGILFVIAIALGVGAVNVILIRYLKLSSIIATLATYSALQGVCLWLRPIAEGPISEKFVDKSLYGVRFHAGRADRARRDCDRGRHLAVPHVRRLGSAGDGTRRGSRRPAAASASLTCSCAPSSSPPLRPRSAACSSPPRSRSATPTPASASRSRASPPPCSAVPACSAAAARSSAP